MKRKTVDVGFMKQYINEQLKDSTCSRDIRLGYCAILETILHSTGNYRGYTHLFEEEVPHGQKPGVILGDSSKGENNLFPDDSRRRYF